VWKGQEDKRTSNANLHGIVRRSLIFSRRLCSDSALLGLAICADGSGRDVQHSEDHRFLHESQRSISCFSTPTSSLGLELFGGPIADLGSVPADGRSASWNMFVAYRTAEHDALVSILSEPGKFYVADPYKFLCAALMVPILDVRLFSLDAVILTRWKEQAPFS